MIRGRVRLGKIKSRKRAVRRPVTLRGQGGIYLVEMLVALTVSSMLSAALVDSISAIHRFSNKAQNQMLASAMTEEAMDQARNIRFSDLSNPNGPYQGTFNLQVNSSDPVAAPLVFPRPLMVDSNLYTWSPAGVANRFPFSGDNTVTETVKMAPDGVSVQVLVQVNWTDPDSGTHQYKAQTVIAPSGIHV